MAHHTSASAYDALQMPLDSSADSHGTLTSQPQLPLMFGGSPTTTAPLPSACEVEVEVLLKSDAVPQVDVAPVVAQLACQMITVFSPGKEVPFGHVKELRNVVASIRISDSLDCDVDATTAAVSDVRVSVARLTADAAYVEGAEDNFFEEPEGEEAAACEVTPLPHTSLVGLWESLYYDAPRGSRGGGDDVEGLDDGGRQQGRAPPAAYCGELKASLLSYCKASLIFSDFAVDPCLVSWNRVILFHGPPGTGKTSLCRAVAQKLSVSLSERYRGGARLVEINTHSLFSKWFSESGKLVMKLFKKVREMAEDPASLVVLLIDEVESLASARKAALSSSEPSDAIRVVNALLTQLDALRRFPNVLTLCTSNITEAIDLAFVDRADYKVYIGPPGVVARQHLLTASINELIIKKLIAGVPLTHDTAHLLLRPVLGALDGCSGRLLRKLPFLAFAAMRVPRPGVDVQTYVQALQTAVEREFSDRARLGAGADASA